MCVYYHSRITKIEFVKPSKQKTKEFVQLVVKLKFFGPNDKV